MSQHITIEPTFPTQSELRILAAEAQQNPLSRQLFFDAHHFRAFVDLDGVVVAVNNYPAQRLGVDLDLILDRPMWEDPLFGGDPLWEGRMRSRFAEALASPTDTIEFEDQIGAGDAPVLIVRVRIAALRNADGVPIGFLLDSEDVEREYRSRALVREQQRLLHVIFERTQQLVAILDPDGKVMDVNDAVSRIGLSRSAVVGRTIVDLGALESPERAAEWQARIAVMQTATEPRHYFDIRDDVGPDGERIAIDVSMTPVRNDDGTLDLILLEFREQTARYEAEERLRESEERFRAVVETLPQMVWVSGPHGELEYLSPAWEEFTGRGAAELCSGDWVDLLHPDDYAHVAGLVQGEPFGELEFRLRNRDGEYRWMMSRGRAVFDEQGKIRRWFGATTDITERRAAEELFRSQSQQIEAAASLAGLGSFVWRADARELRTDERFDRIVSFGDQPTGGTGAMERFLDRVHPDDRDRVADRFRQAMTFGGAPFHDQYRLLVGPADGEQEERWVGCVASVEFDEAQQPQRMFGAIQDLTTMRRQDEARVRLQKVEAIGTLVGAVAHDFNNVIGAILSYARVAEIEMRSGQQPVESIAEIARGARRAADILGRLMTFGRQEPPRLIRFDVHEIIDEAVALLRPAFPVGVELSVELPPKLPPLDGDPTQIHQLVVNLLTNAAQVLAATPHGRVAVRGAAVELGAASAEAAGLEPGSYVRISVQDNGPGIPPAVLHRVFDPFFTTKPTGQGTGLGLAAVHSIARAHRGAVSAQSPPSGGALFEVWLPIVEDAARPDRDRPSAQQALAHRRRDC
ncbi:MAG: PAS domain S-box protein [Patulibacter sp.]